MTSPLLETKLRIPTARSGSIPRPRLSARLNAGRRLPLTLLSAPAGFGKTTLLADWLASADLRDLTAAWVSLDERDNDALTFWSYVVTALRRATSEGISDEPHHFEPLVAPSDVIVFDLINGLVSHPTEVLLVLDDYHLIESPDVHSSLEMFVDNLPLNVHVVLAARSDPGIPLARMRARGELAEIRAADLRFTAEEAAAYLNGPMGLSLSGENVSALEHRTEGWIAALQLAALSMQGRDDPTGFIAGFTGDDRYIVDYLVEEVLQRQTPAVRQFLLRTSILERLNGSLCDAVTGQSGGRAMLTSLDRSNLFVVPLDDSRQWYRYHHLFADMLRAHLADEQPDAVRDLHAAASRWFEHAGEPYEAIRHSVAAKDTERTADLIELEIPALLRSRQEHVFQEWFASLPDDTTSHRPVLSDTFAGVLLSNGGDLAQVEHHLDSAERYTQFVPKHGSPDRRRPPQMVVLDEAMFLRLPESIAVHRAGLSLLRGDLDGTIAYARRALALADPDDDMAHAAAGALLGLAAWTIGDLAVAEAAYTDSLSRMKAANHVANILGVSIALADIQDAQGRLRDATATYRHALRLAGDDASAPLRGEADMHVGLSDVLYESGELAAAQAEVDAARQLGEQLGLPQNPYRWRVAQSRLHAAAGDYGQALSLLEQAAQVFTSDFSPNVRPVPALIARLHIAIGRTREPMAWVREQGLSVTDELTYVQEFEHITLARTLLAQHTAEQDQNCLRDAAHLLDRLLTAAEDGGRIRSVIEILVLQAQAHRAAGDLAAAQGALARAVSLAEPEGYVRLLVDAGAPAAPDVTQAQMSSSVLVDPLSERELDVLRLLATDLDGPGIARHLFISLNTVRTHTKNIYTKLGVTSRRAAVRRADELRILH